MRADSLSRTAGAVAAAMLVAGSIYTAARSIRQFRELFARPAVAGESASVDAYLAPVKLASSAQFRQAVRCFWPSNDAIDVVGTAPLSDHDINQIYFVSGYLLYPRPVTLGDHGAAQRTIAAGARTQTHQKSRQVSDLLTLVQKH
jgi:hypothetical protein